MDGWMDRWMDDGVCSCVSLCNKSLAALHHLLFLALNKASQLLPINSLYFGILPTLVTQNF
jgi:hypothetical protein